MAEDGLKDGEVCIQVVDCDERFYAVDEERLKEIYAMPLGDRRPALLEAVRRHAVHSTSQCLYTLVLDGVHDGESWDDCFGDADV